MDEADRRVLGTMLRRCRARVQPSDVGLAPTGRRRTPGLRRQEVAQLAGMSVDYYIRIEQGRGPTPSPQVLTAIGRALRLSDAERAYLHQLVGVPPPAPGNVDSDVRSGLLHLLDRLDDSPALVCDARTEVVAWNRMAAALLPFLVTRDDGERNLARLTFTDDGVRRHTAGDGGGIARDMVAMLRTATVRYRRDTRVAALIEQLTEVSPDFHRLWDEPVAEPSHSHTKRIQHDSIGRIELECESLHDPERDQWMIIFTAPPGTAAHDALELLSVIGTQNLGEPV